MSEICCSITGDLRGEGWGISEPRMAVVILLFYVTISLAFINS